MTRVILGTTPEGTIALSDINNNAVVDAGEIEAVSDGPANPDPTAVQAALQEIGVNGAPIGTPINPLRACIEALQNADSWAKKGDVGRTNDYLGQASDQARRAGISVSGDRIRTIRQSALEHGVDASLQKADSFAFKGDEGNMEFYLNQAAEYVSQLGTTPEGYDGTVADVRKDYARYQYDEALRTVERKVRENYSLVNCLVDQLRELATAAGSAPDSEEIEEKIKGLYAFACEEVKKKAERDASLGLVDGLEQSIFQALEYATGAGVEIDENWVAALEKKGGKRGYVNGLRTSRIPASRGDLDQLDRGIEMARKGALLGDITPDEDKIDRLERTGNARAVSRLLKEAGERAKRGIPVGPILSEVRAAAAKGGVDVEPDRLAALEALSTAISAAKLAAQQGDVDMMRFALIEAGKEAALARVKLKPADLQSIEQLGNTNGLTHFLAEARAYASQGNLVAMRTAIETARSCAKYLAIKLDPFQLAEIEGIGIANQPRHPPTREGMEIEGDA